MFTVLAVLCALVLGFAAYVRLAPVAASAWHEIDIPKPGVGLHPGTGRFVGQFLVESDGPALLARLDEIALATPRTVKVAGSVAEGRITYETRSKLWRFPDYTSIALIDDPSSLVIYARLRFGLDDLGVNRARVMSWARKAGLQPDAGRD